MQRSMRHINFAMIFRVIGWLLMIEASFMLIPLVTSYIYDEADMQAFALGAAITAGTGALLTFGLRPNHTGMGKHEGFLLTALVWVIFSIFGMIPLLSSTTPMSVSDAFFEAMSGFTTTGCTTMNSVEHFSHGINMWRSLMQWIGGMGIILFTLAVIPMLNHSGGVQMFNAEVTGITHERLRPRVSQTAKSLWGIYFLLTGLLFGLLCLGPMSVYDSICHAFSTISTGGFSTRDSSLAAWDSNYVDIVVMIFMFLGGTSFILIYRALHGDGRSLWHNDVFRAYVTVISVAYIAFTLSVIVNGKFESWESITIEPLFQVVSTITSTGLSVCNYEQWGSLVLALIFLLMFCGSCAGSTSGGAKIDRMLFLIKNSRNELYRCIHPNTITTVRINGKVVPTDIVSKVIAFLCIYVLVIVFGGVVLTALGVPLVDSFFSSFSCVSNTGFGAGITGYGESFDAIPDAGKWVLSWLMLVGRLELFTVLLLFTPGFWRK